MQTGRSSQGPKGDINVTPLVDVVLVLLIIFMVITPMLQKGAEVELPIAENPDKEKSVDEQITISITADGKIFWETEPMSDQDLSAKLAEVYSSTPSAPIFVKGDVKARYGRVREVMKVINEVGFESVGVITKEAEEDAA